MNLKRTLNEGKVLMVVQTEMAARSAEMTVLAAAGKSATSHLLTDRAVRKMRHASDDDHRRRGARGAGSRRGAASNGGRGVR